MLKKLQIKDLNKITLDDFVLIQIADVERRYSRLAELKIGSQTIQFISMFFSKPQDVIKNLNENYFYQGGYKKDLAQIHFLNQANLSEQLFDFLQTIGIESSLLETSKVN